MEGLEDAMKRFDTAGWFREKGRLLITGGTGTNVADICVIVNEGHK